MKKIALFMLVVVMVTAVILTPSMAATNAEQKTLGKSTLVSARYNTIAVISQTFSITNGKALCAGSVTAKKTSYTVKVTATLQQYKNGAWINIGSWSKSVVKNAYVSVRGEKALTKGYSYRCKLVSSVYNNSTLLESVTKYSTTKAYKA